MSLISPDDLRSLRNALRLTAEQAAASIGLKERTWQSYEAPIGNPSHRSMKVITFQRFCQQHCVPFPPYSNDGRLLLNNCKVISITTLKGGVGKSPITVNVATELTRRGKRVAVISSDMMFDLFVGFDVKKSGFFDPKGRAVHYYAEEEVELYKAEVNDLKHELSEKISESALTDSEEIESRFRYLIKKIANKKSAPYSMMCLVAEYDYILLDINKELYKTLLLSNIIVLVVDNSCMMSVWAAEHFCEDIVKLNGNEPVANLYTLVTNHAPGGDGTEFLEYIDEDDEGAAARKYIIEGYKHQSRVYSDARQLAVPMLRTFMTKAHAMETEKYNRGRDAKEGYGYFDSLLDIAPDSLASDEIRRLTDEILDCIVKDFHAAATPTS
ncbi:MULTISPECIES: ParA family protein [Pseudomonas]|uniref:AAA family ATPase n=1 Tax=Pseudomonas carnis TaxID=2487355 RepID=A0ABT5RCK4_9PSED|nr:MULTISPECIES: AAA family ATPase [Pseudomonas]MDD1943712.1 AAA family ATPase [Pseudomonas carnis]NMX46721.1 AAA family ATPase [Pseudomonas sp. WS 5407]